MPLGAMPSASRVRPSNAKKCKCLILLAITRSWVATLTQAAAWYVVEFDPSQAKNTIEKKGCIEAIV